MSTGTSTCPIKGNRPLDSLWFFLQKLNHSMGPAVTDRINCCQNTWSRSADRVQISRRCERNAMMLLVTFSLRQQSRWWLLVNNCAIVSSEADSLVRSERDGYLPYSCCCPPRIGQLFGIWVSVIRVNKRVGLRGQKQWPNDLRVSLV